MRISIGALQKKLLASVQGIALAKWQYVYYVLAAFNLLTVATSLFLNHRIAQSYTQSIEENRRWASHLETVATLGERLGDLNIPGNNIFDSGNVALESRQLATAQIGYQQNLDSLRQELRSHSNDAQVMQLLKDLEAVDTEAMGMIAETELILSYFRSNQPEMAARRMAMMDRQYHQANGALAVFRQNISQIQQALLAQQQDFATSLRWYETAIAMAMMLMVIGVTLYGHHLAQKMRSTALEKERTIAELQQAEALLKEQAQQLQSTLAQLQKTQVQLIQSEKMSSLGQMVAGIAHEINNPVSFIHGNLRHVELYAQDLLTFLELYQRHYPDPVAEIQAEMEEIDLVFLQNDLVKLLASMKIGTERIRQIVLSLRNFSRLDEADCKVVDIHEGIESTLVILQHGLKAHPDCPAIEVVRDYAQLPLVECYPGQLNQVMMNILTNAIDVLNEGDVASRHSLHPRQITIRTSQLDDQWIAVAISDNGPGIPEEAKARIFDPFFTTKQIGKGTGMGLSISYQIIVEKHGGKLKCFSSPAQGTEFVIEIPMQQKLVDASSQL